MSEARRKFWKEKREYQNASQELVITMLRAGHLYRRNLEQFFSSVGLTNQQYNVLRILKVAGKSMPIMDISERLIEPSPGITRHINHLVKVKLIEIVESEGDKRKKECKITNKALHKMGEVEEKLLKKENDLTQGLSDRDKKALVVLLNKSIDRFE